MKSCSSQVSLAHSFYPVLQYIPLLPQSLCMIIVFLLANFFSDHQVRFYTIPSLDSVLINPIRHVVAFAVDDQHLKRPGPTLVNVGIQLPVEPVDFCVVKRTGIAMYTLKDRLAYQRVRRQCPLPPRILLSRTSSRKYPFHKQVV
jgi:hypothetical protein